MEEVLTIGICFLYNLSKASDTYRECAHDRVFLLMLHGRTWSIATRVIKQNLEPVDRFVRLIARGEPTLSPARISFMRFLASGFRTPSHDVVPTASKSSTLNLDVDETDRLKESPRVFEWNSL